MNLRDIEQYLPKYLSEESLKTLLDGVRQFPDSIAGGRMYTTLLSRVDTIFQGDVYAEMPVVRLPDNEVRYAPCMVFSNTCDASPGNERVQSTHIVYAPLIDLNGYAEKHRAAGVNRARLDGHLEAIRKQEVTSIFYLPAGGALTTDKIVFLDTVLHMPRTKFAWDTMGPKRMLTLSDLGLWLLVVKLAIHFSRIRERVDRGAGVVL